MPLYNPPAAAAANELTANELAAIQAATLGPGDVVATTALAPDASAVTYDPAVLGETDGQAVAEALALAGMQRAIKTVTSAELLAIFTTPITVIPDVAGKLHVVLHAVAVCHFVGTAYSTTEPLILNGAFGSQASFALAILDNEYDTVALATLTASASFLPVDDAGGALVLTAGANPTGGGGSLDLIVFYIDVDV